MDVNLYPSINYDLSADLYEFWLNLEGLRLCDLLADETQLLFWYLSQLPTVHSVIVFCLPTDLP